MSQFKLENQMKRFNGLIQFFVLGPTMVRRSSLPGSGLSNRKSSRSATVKTPQIMIGMESPINEDKQR